MTTSTLLIAPRAQLSRFTLSPAIRAALVIMLVTFGFRATQFGNPLAGLDDQFYLLVGDRMWSGALPYLDIWDRKPAGLFLLYAAIRVLPGDGIVAYQMVGTLFLALTGAVVARISLAVLPWRAAVLAGLMVVGYGTILGCGFGEAPIFYDLLTAVAGMWVLAMREGPQEERLDWRAPAAMLLCGASLTLKTSAVFESICFGLMLLHQDSRCASSTRVRRAALYLACGLAPTLALALFYWWQGGLDEFLFANFRSPFLRTGGTAPDSFGRLAGILLLMTPLTVPAITEWRHIPPGRRGFLGVWLVAGFISYVAIGRFYEHYALPLVTPLALIAAYGFRNRLVAVLAVVPVIFLLWTAPMGYADGTRRDRADIAALVNALPSSVSTECLFIYEGPLILYHLSQACLPGRYVFSGHFTEHEEEGALERPMADILRETLARRPAAIVSYPLGSDGPLTENDRILATTLARLYRPIYTGSYRLYGAQRYQAIIWQRRR